ncbi:hypothetical protein [Cypionkella sp. TWP1-2-1b2]|uniref:hypothetical protein n=1 Tax=Cypionkella sp. TWP1-2-1b2 TaxID=2804675 RepID=UPI003CEF6D92
MKERAGIAMGVAAGSVTAKFTTDSVGSICAQPAIASGSAAAKRRIFMFIPDFQP